MNKNNLIQYIRYQLNSVLSVSLRSSCIYIFTDVYDFNYSLIFWISFILVSLNSFYVQKKYVFKKNNQHSFSRFIRVGAALGSLEFLFSYILLDRFNLNVIAFLIVGFGIFIIRFILNKNYVFENKV